MQTPIPSTPTPTASTSARDTAVLRTGLNKRGAPGRGPRARGLPAADLRAACVLEAGAVGVAAAVRAHAAAGAGVRRDPAGFSSPGRVSQQPQGPSSTAERQACNESRNVLHGVFARAGLRFWMGGFTTLNYLWKQNSVLETLTFHIVMYLEVGLEFQ